MTGMVQFPNNYFELAIADPPYGIGIDGQKEHYDTKNPKHSRKGHLKEDWDNEIPDRAYFDELRRISRNQIIWGGNYFVEHLTEGHKGWIIWDKAQHGLTMSDCEIAYSSFDCPTRIWTQNRVILLQEGTIHPTQKPIKLYEWLLAHYAKPGDKILDTHVGSASSLIACYNLNFDYLGFEKNKDIWEMATDRVDAVKSQMRIII
jgi:site-specific DNA-methyltransferase (adenine-specific)